MSDTNDLIAALLRIGAGMSRNENGEMVAQFNGPISTQTDVNEHLHIREGDSSVNLTAHGYKIAKSEITLSPL